MRNSTLFARLDVDLLERPAGSRRVEGGWLWAGRYGIAIGGRKRRVRRRYEDVSRRRDVDDRLRMMVPVGARDDGGADERTGAERESAPATCHGGSEKDDGGKDWKTSHAAVLFQEPFQLPFATRAGIA
jgi:hypothetical protein